MARRLPAVVPPLRYQSSGATTVTTSVARRGAVSARHASLRTTFATVGGADALAAAICHLHMQVLRARLIEALPRTIAPLRPRKSILP